MSQQTTMYQQMIDVYRTALSDNVPIEQVQETLSRVEKVVDNVSQKHQAPRSTMRQRFLHLLPVVFVTLGSIMITNALWPIVSHFLFASGSLQRVQLVAPVPENQVIAYSATVVEEQKKDIAIAHASEDTYKKKPVILNEKLDYTNLSNWFVDYTPPQPEPDKNDDMYYIDIPEIDVENAEVKIGGTNLDDNLIQYPGTAMPGELGAPVIFGHSVLRQFYRPSVDNPKRYNSIFSYIMTLDKGDEINVTYDGIKYTYKVFEKHEVKPDDLFILEQRYDNRLLKLVTCVPEGTYLRRGVVVAQLENVD